MENRFLFRAKRKDNGEWTEGFLLKRWDGLWIFSIDEKFADLIIPSTLCQCTGLKDKNGKLIWENDICDRKEQYPEIVEYRDGDWTLDYSYVSHKERGACYCNLGFYAEERKCVEVIGNIFDNPELLEVQE